MAGSFEAYLEALNGPHTKIARLDFLSPGGGVMYSIGSEGNQSRNNTFIQNGELSVNLQNGQRRTASITLANLDGDYSFAPGKMWFGQQLRLMEGIRTPNGDFLFPQGVFYVKDPDEAVQPNARTVTLHLVDKWSYLDGSLFGNLDGIYEIAAGTNIFTAIQSILDMDRGNGRAVDSTKPLFTEYYNDRVTPLPDGTTVSDLLLPYTYRLDSDNGTYAEIILEMANIISAWVGYDAAGRLRIDPSANDIMDAEKPVQWEFSTDRAHFMGATYTAKNASVYNDIIVVGGSLTEYGYTSGRATNDNPKSPTNYKLIGRKVLRETHSDLYANELCENLAKFMLKRQSILQKSITITCAQLFHINENQVVIIRRPDLPGSPFERHLVTGYTRPISQTGNMQIQATSVNDIVGP